MRPFENRFQVYAEKLTVESISDSEALLKRLSFGCDGKSHAKDILYETYDQQGEGDIVAFSREPTEHLGPCDTTCSGNITGRRGWFTATS